jgi:YVTN family beta-propeller protein
VGRVVETGWFPVNSELSPDGKLLAVLHAGIEHSLATFDAATGREVSRLEVNEPLPSGGKDGLYFGLTFHQPPVGPLRLYACRGASDAVSVHPIDPEGRIGAPEFTYQARRPFFGDRVPYFISSCAPSADGSKVYAVGNQSFALTKFQGTLLVFNRGQQRPASTFPLPGFPLDCRLKTSGSEEKLYVTSELSGTVAVVDPVRLSVLKSIPVGDTPTHLLLSSDQSLLYASCSGSDHVAVIDTKSDTVVRTLLVRPPELRGLPGAGPLGMSLGPKGESLFVALSDLNAAAEINLQTGKVASLIPAGWHPTDAAWTGSGLAILAAKGARPQQPNRPAEPPTWDAGPNIRRNLRGAATWVPWPPRRAEWTRRVIEQNFLNRVGRPLPPKPDGIRHVIYIVKENRTYDQFFGDFPEGNGDPSLHLYGDDVIPNQRALAKRFLLSDNFYVCAEMSADGWSWSTAGITSSYVQRNAQYEYSGRQREYDYEGQNNGTPADARGQRNVNTPPGGYLWDNALRRGVEFRNYGMYIAQGVAIRDLEGRPIAEDNTPTMKAFEGRWDPSFRMYDLDYADSDVWEKLGRTFPKHRREWGPLGLKSRFSAWQRDYRRLTSAGLTPPLMLLRLGNDHTAGTTPGAPTPAAMIADNDYALGQIVEEVSRGPLWRSTAIVVVEDDAQGGYDHVDGHRSHCWIISPWVKKGTVYRRFSNTDSAIRTVEWLLGLPPSNQMMATAQPMEVFGGGPRNDDPYRAILPARSVMKANTEDSYRARESKVIFHTYREESAPDRELADILWGAEMRRRRGQD